MSKGDTPRGSQERYSKSSVWCAVCGKLRGGSCRCIDVVADALMHPKAVDLKPGKQHKDGCILRDAVGAWSTRPLCSCQPDEVIIHDRELSEQESIECEDYLMSEYGIDKSAAVRITDVLMEAVGYERGEDGVWYFPEDKEYDND